MHSSSTRGEGKRVILSASQSKFSLVASVLAFVPGLGKLRVIYLALSLTVRLHGGSHVILYVLYVISTGASCHTLGQSVIMAITDGLPAVQCGGSAGGPNSHRHRSS